MIINLLGTMGIGKSTICKQIQDEYGFRFVPEEFENNPYWKQTYDGSKPEYIKMQIVFLNQYIKNIFELNINEKTIFDQQLYGGFAFVKTQYDLKLIDAIEYEAYIERMKLIYELLLHAYPDKIILMNNIILTLDYDETINRINKRNRKAESNIDPNFIKTLSENFKCIPEFFQESTFRYLNIDNLKEGEIPEYIKSML